MSDGLALASLVARVLAAALAVPAAVVVRLRAGRRDPTLAGLVAVMLALWIWLAVWARAGFRARSAAGSSRSWAAWVAALDHRSGGLAAEWPEWVVGLAGAAALLAGAARWGRRMGDPDAATALALGLFGLGVLLAQASLWIASGRPW